jgi:poly(3-hydroxybutyrate) depolymerase
MKKFILLSVLVFVCLTRANAAKINKAMSIVVNGETRQYWLYIPSSYKSNCPLVVALHGAGGDMNNHSPRFDEISENEGCVVVYPQGKLIYFPVFGGSVNGWDASGEENGDVDFILAVVDEVVKKFKIDSKRVYCCGFSNGGMMTYALTNTCADIFAAFASISGFPLNEFHFRHTGKRPVPFLHIHGKQDDFVKYSLMPVIVDEMVARTGANPVPVKTTVSGKYDKSLYAAGEGGFPYIYYEMNGMGHSDFTNNTESNSSSQTMWNFFKEYTLDSPCDTTLKWRPRIETEGYQPRNHGWIMNSGTTLLSFGREQNTSGKQNVYRSLQLTTGRYKLCFNSQAAAETTIGVKIQKLTGSKNTVLDSSVEAGKPAELFFNVEDGWGEYRIVFSRPTTSDEISITDIALYSATEEESTAISLPSIRNEEGSSPNTLLSETTACYSLSGERLSSPRPGINIVRTAKGQVKKVLVK